MRMTEAAEAAGQEEEVGPEAVATEQEAEEAERGGRGCTVAEEGISSITSHISNTLQCVICFLFF
jgi:hypothetical protein